MLASSTVTILHFDQPAEASFQGCAEPIKDIVHTFLMEEVGLTLKRCHPERTKEAERIDNMVV